MKQKSEIKIGFMLLIGIIIIVTLIVLILCRLLIYNKNHTEANNQPKEDNSNTNSDIMYWTPKEKEDDREVIYYDELCDIYSKMDYSDSTEIQKFNNYHIAKYKDKEFYIIDEDYGEEYDIKYIDLDEKFTEEEKSNQEFKNLPVSKIMDYDEYAKYCEEWKFEKKYDDKTSNYIVYSYESDDSYLKARLSEIEYNDDTAKLYMWTDYTLLDIPDTFLYKAYMLVVPTQEKINNIEVQQLDTQGEMNISISRELYGDDYNGQYVVMYSEDS